MKGGPGKNQINKKRVVIGGLAILIIGVFVFYVFFMGMNSYREFIRNPTRMSGAEPFEEQFQSITLSFVVLPLLALGSYFALLISFMYYILKSNRGESIAKRT